MLLEELVDAVGICPERGLRVVPQQRQLLRRDAREAIDAELPVRVERSVAEDLGEPTSASAPVELHLKEAILRGHVALEIEKVVDVLGEDVRYSVRVAIDFGALVDPEQAVLAVDRRERPVHEDESGKDQARDEQHREKHEREPGLAAPAHAARCRAGDTSEC